MNSIGKVGKGLPLSNWTPLIKSLTFVFLAIIVQLDCNNASNGILHDYSEKPGHQWAIRHKIFSNNHHALLIVINPITTQNLNVVKTLHVTFFCYHGLLLLQVFPSSFFLIAMHVNYHYMRAT